MKAVIVLTLFTILLQIIQRASSADNAISEEQSRKPRSILLPSNIPFLLPPCFPNPPAPPGPLCSKKPTGALAVLLEMVGNLLNLPKGSLSQLPLCCESPGGTPVPTSANTLPAFLQNIQLPPGLNLKTPLNQIPPEILQGIIFQLLRRKVPPGANILPGIPSSIPGFNLQTPLNQIPPEQLQSLISQLINPRALAATKLPILNSLLAGTTIPPFLPPRDPRPSILPCRPSCSPIPGPPLPPQCICNVPYLQNTIRTQEEQFLSRSYPITEKTVTSQEESFIRQVPIVQRFTRPVIETTTRHIPIIRKRIRTVVEPYTSHVPVLMKFTRPVEETVVRTVPVVERRSRPVVSQCFRQVPITETIIRPVVQSQVTQIPVRQKIVKNFIERRAQQYLRPCSSCQPPCPFPPCDPYESPPFNPHPHDSSPTSFLSESTSSFQPITINNPVPPCSCPSTFPCCR